MSSKICLVTSNYPPETGGPAKFALTFSNWCIQNNIPCTVITTTDKKSNIKFENGVKIVSISRKSNYLVRILKISFVIRANAFKKTSVIANGCFIETSLATLGIRDFFTVKIPGDVVWERARNNGSTNSTIDEFQKNKLNVSLKIFRFLFSLAIKRASGTIVPSSHLFDLCLNWGVKKENIKTIFNSVDTKVFSPNKSISKKYDVISVCRLVEWKGLEELITICSELNLSLAIAGSGPAESELRAQVRGLGSNVKFLGEVSQSNLPLLYNESRFFVLNSSFEATSYSLLEARACGIPSIANARTGSSEVIRHKIDGFLVNGLDNMNLHDALSQMISDQFPYEKFGNAARFQTQQLFNTDNNFLKIYEVATSFENLRNV